MNRASTEHRPLLFSTDRQWRRGFEPGRRSGTAGVSIKFGFGQRAIPDSQGAAGIRVPERRERPPGAAPGGCEQLNRPPLNDSNRGFVMARDLHV